MSGSNGPLALLLAHGAGAGIDSPFMSLLARLLGDRSLTVLPVEFAYMSARRQGGKRRPPPRAETLTGEYEAAIRSVPGDRPLFIGGKSMGGRVASMIAGAEHAAGRVAGLVCVGYPFHPTAKPEQLRVAHLERLACPTLFVQGERDPFGSKAEVAGYPLAPSIRFHWAGDGDHDLGPRGGSGHTRKGNLAAAADAIAAFMIEQARRARGAD